ncbi:MAG: undecaprenyl-diphosphate phosphatase [Clostridia bacterium]|nr:undecaprenyl-diphosphate phosphatase [Clostridia bacterium]
MLILELLKSLLLGIVEGITEWLPISSTGHMILLNEFLSLNVSPAFWELFEVVIQLGAIFAVIVLFFHKLNPFAPSKSAAEKKGTWNLWLLVILAVLPSAVIGLLLDDWLNEKLYNPWTVAVMLIVYGVAFLFIEKLRANCSVRVDRVEQIGWRDALLIGTFQVLAIIPGTSRSGSTILGAMMFGLSRTAAAEFSFYLAIPTMAGASLLKAAKFFLEGNTIGGTEWAILLVGCLTAFAVSLLVIRYLMDYVRRHSFSVFGVYRIVLGFLVLGYFLLFR